MGQRGVTLWLTGLSGVGKTTVANAVYEMLRTRGYKVEHLDGDLVRQSLTEDLGFSEKDRFTNIKRVAFVAKLLTRNDVIVLASFISPYRVHREYIRQEIGEVLEVYVNASLEECIKRDVKGLYARAMSGEIANFTGISAPYEPPLNAELELRTDREEVALSAGRVIKFLEEHRYIF